MTNQYSGRADAELDRELARNKDIVRASKKRIAEIKKERRRRAELPAEPVLGSVVTFSVRYSHGTRAYRFAAIHASQGRWYVTGSAFSGLNTWQALLGFYRSKVVCERMRITIPGPYVMDD